MPEHHDRSNRAAHPTGGSARWLRTCCRVLACLLVAGPAWAHHGISNFDLNREIEISGTVARLALVNPHSWLYVHVTGEDGRMIEWQCELRGASVLRRSGWTADMFAPGTRVTITGAPDRFAPNTCYLGTAIFSDGTRVDRYGQLRRAAPPSRADRPLRRPNGDPNIAGEWASEQRVLTDPRGMSGAFLPISVAERVEPGTVPEGMQAFPGTRGSAVSLAEDPIGAYWNRPSAMPLTEAGAKAIAGFDGASTDNPRLRCEPTNILFDWTFEADVNRIVHEDERILLFYGSMGLERTVHLNLAGHPADLTPSRAGHSIGRWEDDVLVVETVGFLPGILSADGRVPHSDGLRVVERFRLDPDTLALRRTYVATDPLYFDGEYTGADIVYPSDVPYQEIACDDRSYKAGSDAGSGSAGMRNWIAVGLLVVFAVWWTLRRGFRPRPSAG